MPTSRLARARTGPRTGALQGVRRRRRRCYGPAVDSPEATWTSGWRRSIRPLLIGVTTAVLALAAAVSTGAVRSTAAGSAPAVGPTSAGPESIGAAASGPTLPGAVLDLPLLQTSDDRRIVDSRGRDVLLRGANVNSLGEYWQGVPGLDPTLPVTDADWDRMAGQGFSVVRLLITWSRVEPTRGVIDDGYLDLIDEHVRAAAARGIYTVIDMHQDAYSASIFTTDPATCPAGTLPAKGWDGAPAWATITDGLSTCVTGERNSSPAVNRAWNNFYDNVDGIRDRFAVVWAAVAARFAGRPEVAGYDLLNEPENPRLAAAFSPVYDDFLLQVIRAVRSAEDGARFDHIVFVEPAVPAGDPTRGLVIPGPAVTAAGNVSAAVHNYAESIGGGSIEGTNDLITAWTGAVGVPNWGGEYGFWDTSPETLAKARRYAADEDRRRWGGAWWQWRQSCGDPHAVRWEGDVIVAPAGTETHLNLLGCPDNTDLGPNDAFLAVLGRGFPRAAPGRLEELRSDPDSGRLTVEASVGRAGGELVVWTPTTDDADHPIAVANLTDVVAHEVPGGRLVTAVVARPGCYALWIGESDGDLDREPSGAGCGPHVAEPVAASPSFTG